MEKTLAMEVNLKFRLQVSGTYFLSDSGGPIQTVKYDNRCVSYVIGVTSFGTACGLRYSAGTYTRVESYLNWIESKVWNK